VNPSSLLNAEGTSIGLLYSILLKSGFGDFLDVVPLPFCIFKRQLQKYHLRHGDAIVGALPPI